MKVHAVVIVLSMLWSGVAGAQSLPALRLSLVGNGLPLIGTLGFEGLGVGGDNLFTPPNVDPLPNLQRLPSLTLTLQIEGLLGLQAIGVRDLVIGGDTLLDLGTLGGLGTGNRLGSLGNVVGVLNPGALFEALPDSGRELPGLGAKPAPLMPR